MLKILVLKINTYVNYVDVVFQYGNQKKFIKQYEIYCMCYKGKYLYPQFTNQ